MPGFPGILDFRDGMEGKGRRERKEILVRLTLDVFLSLLFKINHSGCFSLWEPTSSNSEPVLYFKYNVTKTE